ncbi:MAG TPA: hypothetical protein VMG10_11360 [Gemmataceae bacterium]|nr:hypothetical protein [Gemmataceae bacterium]
MTSAVKSYWSAQIKPDILSPRLLLRMQADALTEQTKGVLVGELLESEREDGNMVLTLDMVAPAINYRHRVLTARYTQGRLYPVLLDADIFRSKENIGSVVRSFSDVLEGKKPECQADNDEELAKLVEKVLTSSSVVSMAQSLIALSNEARTPTNYIHFLKSLTEAERQSAIDEKIAETSHEILDSEVFARTIAVTNASGWGMDDYEVQRIDLGEEACIVRLTYSASGEQAENKAYSGDRVTGTAEAVIDSHGAVEYREITAELVHDDDERDSEEDGEQRE